MVKFTKISNSIAYHLDQIKIMNNVNSPMAITLLKCIKTLATLSMLDYAQI